MLWVKETIDEIISKLNTDRYKGLNTHVVEQRQSKYGLNEFDEEKKVTLCQKIIHHLLEVTAIILIIAAGIAAWMAIDTGEGWAKVIVILSIVVLNVILGIHQESKAEKALEALKKMNSFKTTVIRDGTKQIVEANQLVPGDIIELTAGDVITADARLMEASSLQVEEAPLTGESQPIEKDANAQITDTVPLGDRLNMVYSGCLVTGGRATAIVVETAMETEMGKIARLLNNTEKQKTPLQQRLSQLAMRLCLIAIIAGFIMFLVGIFVHGHDLPEMLLTGVSLGVAAVPETLPIIVTMILSVGVFNMVRKKTIIRKIPAVETVGNTSVICSDKTGTLTQNKMKIQRLWHVRSEPVSVNQEFSFEQKQLVELLASCSNATIEIRGDDDEHVIGDPTELAIIRLLHDLKLDRVQAERDYPRVHELPFDSGRKLMTTVHRTEDGYIAVTKGAFDRIPVNWTEELLEKATRIHDEFAEKALRVIAISVKKYSEMPTDLSESALECDQEFRGLVGMIDPPRPESKEAVSLAKEAGIKTVMITGDHVVTAAAIAKEIGILEEGDRAITGAELSNMTEEELRSQVREIAVYARVSPEDKIRIVQAWQTHNEVVAMTGDGVNDAPALKAADVGVAMGITGTEVSKNAADMVITDDNFATIVDAISEGRTSYDNIRKTVYFLLAVNFSQIFIMLTGMIAFGWAPILAVQILLINVVSDGLPGFFIAFEKAEHGIMKRSPLPKGAGIFAAGLGLKIAQRAITFSILTLVAFAIGFYELIPMPGVDSVQVGRSMAFIVLSWASVINVFNIRSSQSIFKVGFMSNRGIFYAVLASVSITLGIALIPPLARVFSVVSGLTVWHWIIMICLASIQLISVEIQKHLAK